jgi:hypothetical protein
MTTPITRYALPAIFLLLTLAVWGMTRGGEPAAPAPAATGAGYIVPVVTLDSLLTTSASEVDSSSDIPDAFLVVDESATQHAEAVEALVARGAYSTPPQAPTASATPHALDHPELSGMDADLAAIAACGVPCFGERLTRAEVHELALRVSGHATWSAWASVCFTTPGAESGGYVGAVGGPNYHRDGGISWDLSYGQSNTDTLAWLGYDPARVLTDVEYAMEALFETWEAQGYGAWLGCEGPK